MLRSMRTFGRFTLGLVAVTAGLLVTPRVEAKVFPGTAVLNSAQETPPATGSAQGVASVTFDTTTSMLCIAATFSGLSSAEILAHVHGPAAVGIAGGILFPLPLGSPINACVGPLTSE